MKRIYLQKAKIQIARPNTIRDINKQIVLNYVRDRAPISRAEIARETALQRSTISSIVDNLHGEDLIEEIGTGASSGGRKPTLLKLKTGKANAVGIDLTPRETTIAVADLAGEVLEQEHFATSPNIEYMSEQIVKRVLAIAEKYGDRRLKVGMSLPGIVDYALGKVLYIPYFGWRDWDIGQQIFRATNFPVTMDNDANSIALAELWFGDEKIRKINNFITVLVAEGIGTGVVFDGQVYRGEQGAAGEFGHMIVGENAPVECSCGSRDCWEALSSEKATVARYQNLFGANGAKIDDIGFAQLIGLARNGESQAVHALMETAKYLGIGISNLIVGLSPQAIVVSGSITKAWDLIADEIHSVVERSVRSNLSKPVITASTLGDNPTLIGSLSLVLAKIFASAN
ncbi:MAG: ROK family transcriptional regulator [Acidobacteria bacterium]|jgi:predicted NBD/HSP70 family sugar kinase|nr:ROK family transcriptional regulator [Acidobacteriota bacterium]